MQKFYKWIWEKIPFELKLQIKGFQKIKVCTTTFADGLQGKATLSIVDCGFKVIDLEIRNEDGKVRGYTLANDANDANVFINFKTKTLLIIGDYQCATEIKMKGLDKTIQTFTIIKSI